MTLSFHVPGPPQPWERATPIAFANWLKGVVRRRPNATVAEMYDAIVKSAFAMQTTPPRTRDWQGRVGACAQLAMTEQGIERFPAGVPLLLELDVCTDQKGKTAGDASNFQKSVEDGLNRIAWDDDEQVVRWVGQLVRGCHPENAGVGVRVGPAS